MRWTFTRAVSPLVLVVAVSTMALTSVMTPSTVFTMVLPSMIAFAVVAFYVGMKFGESA